MGSMKKICAYIVFAISAICLWISMKLMWNMGVYVDEHNSTFIEICGGEMWMWCNWLRLLLLGVLVLFMFIYVIKITFERK